MTVMSLQSSYYQENCRRGKLGAFELKELLIVLRSTGVSIHLDMFTHQELQMILVLGAFLIMLNTVFDVAVLKCI